MATTAHRFGQKCFVFVQSQPAWKSEGGVGGKVEGTLQRQKIGSSRLDRFT